MQGRAQRVGGEEYFPAAGREFVDVVGRVLSDALQDIDQIVIRVDVVQPTGDDQALQDADVAGTEFGPAEHPVAATHRNHAQGPLERIRIERHVRP